MTKSQEFFLSLRELRPISFRWKFAYELAKVIFDPHRYAVNSTFKGTVGQLLKRLCKLGYLKKTARGLYEFTASAYFMQSIDEVKPWSRRAYPGYRTFQ